ncbi:MAG TPA: rhodanese-like domain-containing protein [Saprospiraceae bacterium]|nr:rhodanese-like domain-containing protein [Saprospiraceae bacterium]
MKGIQFVTPLLLLLIAVACSQGESKTKDATQEKNAAHPKAQTKVAHLSVSQFEKMRGAGVEMNVIDVRTPEEVSQGKIPDALEMDYQADDFEKKIDTLEKEKSYILYCAAGGRSSKAAEMMLQKGFKNVYNLEGGYEAWEKEVSK